MIVYRTHVFTFTFGDPTPEHSMLDEQSTRKAAIAQVQEHAKSLYEDDIIAQGLENENVLPNLITLDIFSADEMLNDIQKMELFQYLRYDGSTILLFNYALCEKAEDGLMVTSMNHEDTNTTYITVYVIKEVDTEAEEED